MDHTHTTLSSPSPLTSGHSGRSQQWGEKMRTQVRPSLELTKTCQVAWGWKGWGEEREVEQIFWGETGNPCCKVGKPALAFTVAELAAGKVELVEGTQTALLLTLAAIHRQPSEGARDSKHLFWLRTLKFWQSTGSHVHFSSLTPDYYHGTPDSQKSCCLGDDFWTTYTFLLPSSAKKAGFKLIEIYQIKNHALRTPAAHCMLRYKRTERIWHRIEQLRADRR